MSHASFSAPRPLQAFRSRPLWLSVRSFELGALIERYRAQALASNECSGSDAAAADDNDKVTCLYVRFPNPATHILKQAHTSALEPHINVLIHLVNPEPLNPKP